MTLVHDDKERQKAFFLFYTFTALHCYHTMQVFSKFVDHPMPEGKAEELHERYQDSYPDADLQPEQWLHFSDIAPDKAIELYKDYQELLQELEGTKFIDPKTLDALIKQICQNRDSSHFRLRSNASMYAGIAINMFEYLNNEISPKEYRKKYKKILEENYEKDFQFKEFCQASMYVINKYNELK